MHLAYRSALLEALAETTIDGLLVVDSDREAVYYNERFLDIWDIPERVATDRSSEKLIEHVCDRVANPDAFRETVEYLYDHPTETSRDLIRFADGRWIDRFSAPVVDDQTNYGRLWVFRDVTAREERERELERQNERLEEFVGIVSHDLRNPLNVASGQLELARQECDSSHLDDVAGTLDRMETLIESLLTLAREGQRGVEIGPTDLEELVESSWQTVETKDATLVTGTDATIHADRNSLRELLENVIRNAIDHAGPEVTVEVGEVTGESGLYISDDGPGIPDEDRSQVFESGYSTTRDGTGFGLAIVERIVDAHGWDVRVTTSETGGARVEITGVRFAE